jgi:hypothetical protein
MTFPTSPLFLNLINLAARQDCVAVIASPPRQSFQMLMTDGQQVCRNVHHPDGIMINGKAHDLAKKENAIFTNCLQIVAIATVHDARFVIEGPVSLAQASPEAQHGHEDHAALTTTCQNASLHSRRTSTTSSSAR